MSWPIARWEVSPFEGLRIKTNAGINMSYYTGTFFQPEDTRAFSNNILAHLSAVPIIPFTRIITLNGCGRIPSLTNKTFGQHTNQFCRWYFRQKNTNTLVGVSGIPRIA